METHKVDRQGMVVVVGNDLAAGITVTCRYTINPAPLMDYLVQIVGAAGDTVQKFRTVVQRQAASSPGQRDDIGNAYMVVSDYDLFHDIILFRGSRTRKS